jgi:uncharacterized protein YndB with AHSA1/START domain
VHRVEIRSEHRYRFRAPRGEVWAALADVDRYEGWWPWLHGFEARALAEDETWRCTIRPPLPYALHCRIDLVTVRAPRLIAARLSGDVTGEAQVALLDGTGDRTADRAPEHGDAATDVLITSQLTARSTPARLVARALPRAARWGHDWVFDTAARQFATAHGWAD